jgi:hypothetical protein
MMHAFACIGRTAEARGLLDLAARYVCMYSCVRACASVCGRARTCAGVSIYECAYTGSCVNVSSLKTHEHIVPEE